MKISGFFLLTSMAAGVLVFVAYSSLAAVERQSAEARCLQNLRALSVAVARYADDHGGALPPAVDREPRVWKWWYNAIFPYVSDMSVFYCPLVPDASPASPLLPVVWNLKLLSYGLNHRLDDAQKSNPKFSMRDISDPDHKILFGESHFRLLRSSAAMWPEDIAPRHEGCANVVFFSGRAASFAASPKRPPRPGGEDIENAAWWELP